MPPLKYGIKEPLLRSEIFEKQAPHQGLYKVDMISKFLLEHHKESTKVMQSTHEEFWNAAKANVYKITDEIYQGAFPTDSTREYLASIGVTSFLNVSGEEIDSSKGQECLSIPFRDGQTIPKKCIKQCLEYIDRCIKNAKKVFVHCTAGQNRSPTLITFFI